MRDCAFVFPGQSSQYVGMGRDLYEEFPVVRSTFQEMNHVLNFDLAHIIFHGPEELLKETLNTQPAIVGLSIAIFRILEQEGLRPQSVAGHSLGEYSALLAAGSMSFEDGIALVRERGRFMEEAYPEGKGTMAAVLGLDLPRVKEACLRAQTRGIVDVANLNCPGQVVLSGQVEAVDEACHHALAFGAKKCVKLQVSGPFHSSLMEPAAKRLEAKLTEIHVKAPEIPVVSNVSGDYIDSSQRVKENLIKQVTSPVRWEESVRRMIQDGTCTFVEVGPGNVLSGLIKRISREVQVYNVKDLKDLKNVLEILKGAG